MKRHVLCITTAFLLTTIILQGCIWSLDRQTPTTMDSQGSLIHANNKVPSESPNSTKPVFSDRKLKIDEADLHEIKKRGLTQKPIERASNNEQKKKSSPKTKNKNSQKTDAKIIDEAMESSTNTPVPGIFNNSIACYEYKQGEIYTVYLSIRKITDIIFKEGEKITNIISGDTENFPFESIQGDKNNHLILKALQPYFETNLIIITTEREYFLHLKSFKESYMFAVQWTYPEDKKKNIKNNKVTPEKIEPLKRLIYDYAIIPKCKKCVVPVPESAYFKNGKTFIVMPEIIRHYELPTLFALDSKEKPFVIDYRFLNDMLIVDGFYSNLVVQYSNNEDKIFIKSDFLNNNIFYPELGNSSK